MIILFFVACGVSFYTIIKPKPDSQPYILSNQFKINPAPVEQKGN